jgi:hypothetical protein
MASICLQYGLGVALGGFAPISAFYFLLSAFATECGFGWLCAASHPYFCFLLLPECGSGVVLRWLWVALPAPAIDGEEHAQLVAVQLTATVQSEKREHQTPLTRLWEPVGPNQAKLIMIGLGSCAV